MLGQLDFDPAEATRLFTIAPNGYVEFVLMPEIVSQLRERASGINLRLTPLGNDLVETGAMSGTTDIVLGRIVDPSDNLAVKHLMDDGLACIVRADHLDIQDSISRKQFESLKHVNVLPPGRMRAGLFQALIQRSLNRDGALSDSHFLAVPEMIAVTDYCATLPRLICNRLARDPRLKSLPHLSIS